MGQCLNLRQTGIIIGWQWLTSHRSGRISSSVNRTSHCFFPRLCLLASRPFHAVPVCHFTCSAPLGPAPSRCPLRQAAFPAQPEPTSAACCLSAGLCLPSSLLGLNEDERQGLVVTEAGGAGREAGSLRLQKAVLLFMFGNKGSGDI